MKILLTGDPDRVEEFMKFDLPDAEIEIVLPEDIPFVPEGMEEEEFFEEEVEDADFSEFDLIIDLNLDEDPSRMDSYITFGAKAIMGCAVKMNLAEIAEHAWAEVTIPFFGMNALPTFIHRERLELSLYDETEDEVLEAYMKALALNYEVVEDRAGMVTPRVVCMIINEACFVLQEGTSDIAGVDRAMKLGTNYPRGPFEWADAIGPRNVFETLLGMARETGDSRYKVAPLLRNMALKRRTFLQTQEA